MGQKQIFTARLAMFALTAKADIPDGELNVG
jgi:hypothetical protein